MARVKKTSTHNPNAGLLFHCLNSLKLQITSLDVSHIHSQMLFFSARNCPHGYTSVSVSNVADADWCYLFSDGSTMLTFEQALSYCNGTGGSLVVLDSKLKYKQLTKRIATADFWIGKTRFFLQKFTVIN